MITIPQYTRRDGWIILGVLVPFVVIINTLLFGSRYFSDSKVLVWASVVTAVILFISWQFHTLVALALRNRFPRDRDMVKRISIAIFLFVLMTGMTMTIIFLGYDYVHFLGYELDENKYNWALAFSVIANVLTTVVHEGIASFEKWKVTLTETEQLKKEYLKSRLLGLKSQVSPHFLFNSLNSLSGLISEDPAEAERFLDEMSKVYRYLLRTNEEANVELGTELQFVRSYYHLLKARYGSAVDLTIHVDEDNRKKLLPPFTLQILLDNILKVNQISKENPLRVNIYVNDSYWLEIKNNLQKRISEEPDKDEAAIENISNKFRLLYQHSIHISQTGSHSVIKVPLLDPEPTNAK